MNLQEIEDNIFRAEDNIEAMLRKIWVMKKIFTSKQFYFPTISAFLESSKEVFPQDVQDIIIEHLQILKYSFQKYFPYNKNKYNKYNKNCNCTRIESLLINYLTIF